MHESKKVYIQKYIFYNIYYKKWKPCSKIPSENELASKFQVSRLTARSALRLFSYNGLLESYQGKGYMVSPDAQNYFFDSIGHKVKSHKQKLEQIKTISLPHKVKLITNLHILATDIKYAFSKSYFNKNNTLIFYQVSFLNKNEIFKIDEKKIEKSLIGFLMFHGIVPTIYTENLIWSNMDILTEKAKALGWTQKNYPIMITTLKNEKNWIEISLKISSPQNFSFAKSIKIIME